MSRAAGHRPALRRKSATLGANFIIRPVSDGHPTDCGARRFRRFDFVFQSFADHPRHLSHDGKEFDAVRSAGLAARHASGRIIEQTRGRDEDFAGFGVGHDFGQVSFAMFPHHRDEVVTAAVLSDFRVMYSQDASCFHINGPDRSRRPDATDLAVVGNLKERWFGCFQCRVHGGKVSQGGDLPPLEGNPCVGTEAAGWK